MARTAKRATTTNTTAWRLVECATNERVWNERWAETRHLTAWARRGNLVAVNSFGTVRLFDVADPLDVRTRGVLELPKLTGGLPEDLPIGFDRDGHVVQASGDVLHVVDVVDVDAPRLIASRPLDPPLRRGAFVDGVLYREGDGERLFRHDGDGVTPFPFVPVIAPTQFARVGDALYGFGGTDDLIVMRASDLARVATKQCPVAYDVRLLHAPEVQLLIAVSGTDTQIVDVAKPMAPTRQKKLYKHEAKGACLAGDQLLLVDGDYQEAQFLTTMTLGRPSTVVGREPFTSEPELGCGYLFLERLQERVLFGLTTGGRFVVLAAGLRL